MKKILFQSDDYGITDAVSVGIIKAIQAGVVRNTGLFVNMSSTKYALELIKNVDVCLGIDINYVAGTPITECRLLPNIVKKNGTFYSSKEILANNKLLRIDGITYIFESDPYPYEEILLETENQVKKFIELTGKLPEYIHPHSICTPNTEKAAAFVAKKYGIYNSVEMMKHCHALPNAVEDIKGLSLESQLNINVGENLLKYGLPDIKDDVINYYIFHCGFVDAELFNCSSLTLRRIKDLEGATNLEVLKYIKTNNIELITYKDLK
ncbi:MAG: ChbG/HpnK family deacetylase [Traorella sp.]